MKLDGAGHAVFTCEKDAQGVWKWVQFLQTRPEWTYGYFESRIRMGADPSLISSGFWFTDVPQGNPVTQHIEIDILENQNLKMNHTIHFATTTPYYRVFSHTLPMPPQWDAWRLFGCQWTPQEIVFYLDGQETYRFDYRTYGVTALNALYAVIGGGGTRPSFLKLEAVPAADRERLWPVFDYVRVYQPRKKHEAAPAVALVPGAAPQPNADGFRLIAGPKVTFSVEAAPADRIESVALIDNGFLIAELCRPLQIHGRIHPRVLREHEVHGCQPQHVDGRPILETRCAARSTPRTPSPHWPGPLTARSASPSLGPFT